MQYPVINVLRLRRIEDANIYFYRDVEEVRKYTKMPKGDDIPFHEAAAAFLQLSATCLKIAIDYEAAADREHSLFMKLMRDEPEETNLIPVASDGSDLDGDDLDDEDGDD